MTKVLTRLAIIHSPISLIAEYYNERAEEGTQDNQKQVLSCDIQSQRTSCTRLKRGTARKRRIFHKSFTFSPKIFDNFDALTITTQLFQQFPSYFDRSCVKLDQVSALIQLLKDANSDRKDASKGYDYENSRHDQMNMVTDVDNTFSAGTNASEIMDESSRSDRNNHKICAGDDEPKLWKSAEISFSHSDLNKVSDEELKKAKAQMEIVYNLHRLKPDDERYVYDKRVDYDPDSDSSWD
jgi:hypothetical protein